MHQPSHRTEQAIVNQSLKVELGRSSLDIKDGSEWMYMLQERNNCLDFTGIQVRGISHRKFILTFVDEEDANNVCMQGLLNIFKLVKKISYIDLVVRRIVWIWCDALSTIALNKETWKSVVGDWGYFLTEQLKPLQNAMFQGV